MQTLTFKGNPLNLYLLSDPYLSNELGTINVVGLLVIALLLLSLEIRSLLKKPIWNVNKAPSLTGIVVCSSKNTTMEI
jgi:hypothetical protein